MKSATCACLWLCLIPFTFCTVIWSTAYTKASSSNMKLQRNIIVHHKEMKVIAFDVAHKERKKPLWSEYDWYRSSFINSLNLSNNIVSELEANSVHRWREATEKEAPFLSSSRELFCTHLSSHIFIWIYSPVNCSQDIFIRRNNKNLKSGKKENWTSALSHDDTRRDFSFSASSVKL